MDDIIHIGGAHVKTGKKTKYALIIEDFVNILIPPPELCLPIFDPHKYFITSGDAITKTKIMSRDIREYTRKVQKAVKGLSRKNKHCVKFEKRCRESASGTTLLMNALKDARGKAVFMEIEWGGPGGNADEGFNILLVTPKNPKPRK